MDIADLICVRAQELHDEEIERKQLRFYICFNNKYNVPDEFRLLEDNNILYNSSRFTFTKINVCMIINEMMKKHHEMYNSSVKQIYIGVHNSKKMLFHTRLPYITIPPICIRDMLRYDFDMDNMTGNRTILDFHAKVWKYIRRFHKNI
jgi:hypothetical protein